MLKSGSFRDARNRPRENMYVPMSNVQYMKYRSLIQYMPPTAYMMSNTDPNRLLLAYSLVQNETVYYSVESVHATDQQGFSYNNHTKTPSHHYGVAKRYHCLQNVNR